MLGHDLEGRIATGLVAQRGLDQLQGILRSHILRLRTLGRLLQSLQSTIGHVPGLRVRHLLTGRLHQRLQPWHERHHGVGILDNLAHVVDDEAARALHLLHLVVQAAGEHRKHRGQRGRLHILHEDAACQLFHAYVSAVEGLCRLDDEGQEWLQVLVACAIANGGHGAGRRLLDFLLDVARQLGDGHGQGHKHVADGPRRLRGDGLDDLQGGLLLRRLGLHAEACEQRRHALLHCEGAHHLDDGVRRCHRGILDVFALVAGCLQDRTQGRDEEWLCHRALCREGAEPFQGGLALRLVADLGDESIHLFLDSGSHAVDGGSRQGQLAA
mmetsp:Transcript_42387/g.107721  ORF Transcript_42387/g.107721 Transcript_42387/m.107721 type:complete len:327 (+) Transcript_42387:2431-3411(+)